MLFFFFQSKSIGIFLICCWGASNEYQKHVFVEKYEKYQYFWIEKKSILSRAMTKFILLPSEKESVSKRKEFAPKGNKVIIEW